MSEDFGIDWRVIEGGAVDIKYARRDLAGLKMACDLCRDFSCAVQAGANIGIFPLYLAGRFAVTHAFEPDLNSFEYFCENVPHYRFGERVKKYDDALGARPGKGFLQLRRRDGAMGNSGAHSGVHHVRLDAAAGGVPINVETIDRLALATCGLIYLDIEGLELDALQGGVATIARCRPVIGVEINKNLDQLGMKPAEIIEWIGAQRYRPAASVGSDWLFAPAEWGE